MMIAMYRNGRRVTGMRPMVQVGWTISVGLNIVSVGLKVVKNGFCWKVPDCSGQCIVDGLVPGGLNDFSRFWTLIWWTLKRVRLVESFQYVMSYITCVIVGEIGLGMGTGSGWLHSFSGFWIWIYFYEFISVELFQNPVHTKHTVRYTPRNKLI